MRELIIPMKKDAIFRCVPESLQDELSPTLPIWKKNGEDLEIDGGCMVK